MKLFPAIDLRDGKCVRLRQGDFSDETIYNENPIEQAKAFEAEGAEFIHIVDLDAAKTGQPINRKIISKIRDAVSAFLQVGGGVRAEADARALTEMGINRAVVGTTAILEPELLPQMASHIGIAAGLDVKDKKLAIDGWTKYSEQDLSSTAVALLNTGIEAFIVTNISSDGMLSGVDTSLISQLLELLPDSSENQFELIASGGVSSLADLEILAELENNGKQVAGVIVGKAIYEGKIDISSAVELLKK